MGMIKQNFKVKSMGNFVLPTAYAYITECHTIGKTGYAKIGIFADRESAVNCVNPFEVVRVDFVLDRNENDRATAYKTAKQPKYLGKEWDEETKTFEDKYTESIFADWQDDIV